MILVGVDAGATRVRAAAVAEGWGLLGSAAAGPANPHNVGAEPAAAEIARAIRSASSGHAPDVVVVGVAGIEVTDLRRDLQRALQASLPGREIHLYADAVIALDGAFPGAPGIIVIAGTGSVAWGRNVEGREARAGGWGHLIDDVGSGYDLSRRALGAVMRAQDGRGPSTALTQRLIATLGVERPERVVEAVRSMGPAGIAALAPIVVNAAAEGDRVAEEIVAEGCRELADAAAAVARSLELRGPHAVAGAGGLFGHETIRDAFVDALRRTSPQARFTKPRLPPVGGAVWKAFTVKGIIPDENLLTRLEALTGTGEM